MTTLRQATAVSAAILLHVLAFRPPCFAAQGDAPARPAPAEAGQGAEGQRPGGGVRWDLDNVVEIALSRHPRVTQADSDTLAARARRGQAASAYYPSIGLAASYTASETFSGVAGRTISTRTTVAQGTVSQLITDFGRTGASVGQADALFSAARETGKSVREDVVLDAKVAYYNVLRAQRILEVSRETVRQRESLLRQARAYYDAGIRARIDVARAEANLFQARAELTSAENDLRIARITLLNRMGVDGPRDFELSDTLATESFPGTMEQWIKEAEESRPDLLAFVERERAADMALRGARAGYYPELAAFGGFGYSGEDLSLDRSHNATVQLSVPLFTGFLTREQVAESAAQLASAKAATTDFTRLVRLQVEQAALSVRAAEERSEARRKEREASQENLRLATGRYEVGAGDIIEMIDAQVQMTRSDTDMIQALYDYSVSIATLIRAIGR